MCTAADSSISTPAPQNQLQVRSPSFLDSIVCRDFESLASVSCSGTLKVRCSSPLDRSFVDLSSTQDQLFERFRNPRANQKNYFARTQVTFAPAVINILGTNKDWYTFAIIATCSSRSFNPDRMLVVNFEVQAVPTRATAALSWPRVAVRSRYCLILKVSTLKVAELLVRVPPPSPEKNTSCGVIASEAGIPARLVSVQSGSPATL